MDLCVSMWSVHRKFYNDGWSVIDFLQFCHEAGVQHVELLDLFWRDADTEVPAVLEYLRSHDMKVAAYAVTNDFVHTDVANRESALQAVQNGISFAKKLGSPVVRVFSGDLKEGYDFESAFGYIVEGLKAAAAEAGDDVILALENHGKLAGRGDQVKRVILEVGSNALKSTFDVGNFYLVGQQPMEALAQLSGYLGHVHVKDFVPSDKGLLATTGEYFAGAACGQGIVPFKDIFSMLDTIGYTGALSVEYEGEGDELEGVHASLSFLRSLRSTSAQGVN
ncbi:sugar phosphate isomerase/epimerase family protein [Alicyclobacillus acidiphilus]|uniref:sugar phosphate isomerase/epimerase family protein n=1 Tax=Alicyclobacillus acidiphilus TaxID=182455 RepID=UPI00082FDE11|nr:sugar phosphate isomerase/epimerase [Alicyclobacillus acidiphilus]